MSIVSRQRMLDMLRVHAFGRRFIFNFAYCQLHDLFPASVDRARILGAIARRLDPEPPPKVMMASINDVLRDEYYSRVSFDQPPAMKSFELLYRVVPLSSFFRKPFALLSQEGISRFGALPTSRDAFSLRQFAKQAVEPEAISTAASVRGRHPFAWAASADEFQFVFAKPPGEEGRTGRFLCQLLAIDGFNDQEPLFLLRYPLGLTKHGFSVRRPNALDGFGNNFFKARSDRDRPPTMSSSGFTLSINLLGLLDRSREPLSSCDGIPEFAAEPIHLSAEFGLHWVGYFNPDWLMTGDGDVEVILAGIVDHSNALTKCMEIINKI